MAYRRIPFAPNEWYHLYSQGIDKQNIFVAESDFQRFQALLYLANSIEPVNFELIKAKNISHKDIFTLPRQSEDVFVRYVFGFNQFKIDRLNAVGKVEQSLESLKVALGNKDVLFINALTVKVVPLVRSKRNTTICHSDNLTRKNKKQKAKGVTFCLLKVTLFAFLPFNACQPHSRFSWRSRCFRHCRLRCKESCACQRLRYQA